MSSFATSLNDSVYQISNVAYPNQVVTLLSPGGATGVIGGQVNDDSKRNQWQATNIGGEGPNQFLFTNQEIWTYAIFPETAVITELVGNPDTQLVWNVIPTDTATEFLFVCVLI
jgi:hypothetical protein